MRILGGRDIGGKRRSDFLQQTPASNIFSQAQSNLSDKEDSKPIFPYVYSNDSSKLIITLNILYLKTNNNRRSNPRPTLMMTL